MSRQTYRRWSAAAVLAALVAGLVPLGVSSTTAAYTDATYAASDSTSAFVPMSMYAGRQSKLVDTSLSLGADKRAYVWGRVGSGGDAGAALGGEATSSALNAANGYPRKVPIPGDPDIVEVAADRRTALAIDASGQVWAWGAGSYLHPESTSQYTARGYNPAMVMKADGTPLSNITMIAAAERNAAIAVDADGAIWRWGNPDQGGVDGYRPQQSPLPAGEQGRPVSVTGGYYMLSAVLDNGNVYVWGSTTNRTHGSAHRYELPGDPTIRPADGAVLVQGLQAWNKENSPDAYITQIGLGGYDRGYGVALLSDNTLLAWGQHERVAGHTQPESPQITASNVATLVPNFYGVSYLTVSSDPAAVGYDLYGWGPANYSLGDGTATHVLVDTNVSALQPGMAQFFWLKVDSDGGVVGFYGRGYNPQGAVGLNAAGTAAFAGETIVREILFPGKPIADLSMLAG